MDRVNFGLWVGASSFLGFLNVRAYGLGEKGGRPRLALGVGPLERCSEGTRPLFL